MGLFSRAVRADPYIRRGYRRQLNSFRACFWSLFYPHNELINIWSHLLPALVYLVALLTMDYWTFHSGFRAPARDVLFIQLHIGCMVCCLLLSALYHCTNAHSEEVSRYSLKLDYCRCLSVSGFPSLGSVLRLEIYLGSIHHVDELLRLNVLS